MRVHQWLLNEKYEKKQNLQIEETVEFHLESSFNKSNLLELEGKFELTVNEYIIQINGSGTIFDFEVESLTNEGIKLKSFVGFSFNKFDKN